MLSQTWIFAFQQEPKPQLKGAKSVSFLTAWWARDPSQFYHWKQLEILDKMSFSMF